jgi:hypothetical protein
MGRLQISEREHVERELSDYFFGRSPIDDCGSGEVSFRADGNILRNTLADCPQINSLLGRVAEQIAEEYSDPSKRVHGKRYTDRGRMYRWDAEEQQLIRVQTPAEKEFAKQFFSELSYSKVSSRNFHSCEFKRIYSPHSRWHLCSYNGKCKDKERLTSQHYGMYGRDWFCGPTCR